MGIAQSGLQLKCVQVGNSFCMSKFVMLYCTLSLSGVDVSSGHCYAADRARQHLLTVLNVV